MFNSNYAVLESVVSRSNQDGTVIIMKMDDSNTFFKINGVAAEFWKELSGHKEINQITKEIVNSYNESEEKIVNDIENLVEILLSKELIKKI